MWDILLPLAQTPDRRDQRLFTVSSKRHRQSGVNEIGQAPKRRKWNRFDLKVFPLEFRPLTILYSRQSLASALRYASGLRRSDQHYGCGASQLLARHYSIFSTRAATQNTRAINSRKDGGLGAFSADYYRIYAL